MRPLGQQQIAGSRRERHRQNDTGNGVRRIAGGVIGERFHGLDYTRLCFLPQVIFMSFYVVCAAA